MSYAPSRMRDQWRRAADFVDKILKGTKPAEHPVEQPTKLEFIVNLQDRSAEWRDGAPECAGAGGPGL